VYERDKFYHVNIVKDASGMSVDVELSIHFCQLLNVL